MGEPRAKCRVLRPLGQRQSNDALVAVSPKKTNHEFEDTMSEVEELKKENFRLNERLLEQQLLIEILTGERDQALSQLGIVHQEFSDYKNSFPEPMAAMDGADEGYENMPEEHDQQHYDVEVQAMDVGDSVEVGSADNVNITDDADCVYHTETADTNENADTIETADNIESTDDESVVYLGPAEEEYIEPAENVVVEMVEGGPNVLHTESAASNYRDTLVILYGVNDLGHSDFSIYLLHGALLNAKQVPRKAIMKNEAINKLCEAIGLDFKKTYESEDQLKALRYSRVILMMDRDPECSYIKATFINFLHTFWPELLRLPFLEQFVMPTVTAKRHREVILFYTWAEYEMWRAVSTSIHYTYEITTNKALSACSAAEVNEYLESMDLHRYAFTHDGQADDDHIKMPFSKDFDWRRNWLNTHMQEITERKMKGKPEPSLYTQHGHIRRITYSEFVNFELVQYWLASNKRSISSAVDGLTPAQRKVLYTLFEQHGSKSVRYDRLTQSIVRLSGVPHHRLVLNQVISQMTQKFVGSNNINLLQTSTDYGSRIRGRRSTRSLAGQAIRLSLLARFIFHPDDDACLIHLFDADKKIEPQFYVPIVPMILVNGCISEGRCWSTQIYQYNPCDIIRNIRRMMDKQEMLPMQPWYRNFTGSIEPNSANSYMCYGKCEIIAQDQLEISELPVGIWTKTYMETVLVPLTYCKTGLKASKPVISQIDEYHTSTEVRFIITLKPGELERMKTVGLYNELQLSMKMPLDNMYCFDENDCMKKYQTPLDILREFYPIRVMFYQKRKDYLISQLTAQIDENSISRWERRNKCSELVILKKKTPEMLWIEDLNALEQELDKLGVVAQAVQPQITNDELEVHLNHTDEVEISLSANAQTSSEDHPHEVIEIDFDENEQYMAHSKDEEPDDQYEVVEIDEDTSSFKTDIKDDMLEDDNSGHEQVEIDLVSFNGEEHIMTEFVDDPMFEKHDRVYEQPEFDVDPDDLGAEEFLIDVNDPTVAGNHIDSPTMSFQS